MITSLLIANRVKLGCFLLCVLAFGAITLPSGAFAAAHQMACIDWDEGCIDRLRANPPMLTGERLPKGYEVGRCLLEVDGVTRISGQCAYTIGTGGDFHIEGPRQVFDGIDYPRSQGMADMISTDWWANVFKLDGVWTGYGNDHIPSVHGHESRWGELTRKGACYSNKSVKKSVDVRQHVLVCLWKK